MISNDVLGMDLVYATSAETRKESAEVVEVDVHVACWSYGL